MITVSYRDSRPIYEQIRDNLRALIISGTFSPGERMPSVRELASQLAINPNTIQRAYRELEAEGYICSSPGKGSFVGERREVDSGRKEALLSQFDDAVKELSFLGVSNEELCRRITEGGLIQ